MSNIGNHSTNQCYRDYIQPIGQNTFQVVDSRLSLVDPDWYNKKILDFGCNVGNLILTSNKKILPKNYTGFDVMKSSIDIAKSKFPDYNWIHVDRYNNTFNPTGTNEEITFEESFDYILIIGVFTHMCFDEIKFWINYLKKFLTPTGKIVFSIWEDKHYYSYLGFLDRSFDIDIGLAKPQCNSSIYILNRKELLIDENNLLGNYDWLETFYKRDFLVNELKCNPIYHTMWAAHEIYILDHENI